MTLPVVDEFGVVAVDGPKYKVGATCASPLCNKWADHAHHLVRGIGRPDWVQLPDGTITGNLSPLCARCHKLVTGIVAGGHVHAIRWHEDAYWWANVVGGEQVGSMIEYVLIEPLTEQPPRQGDEEPQDLNRCPHCGRAKKKTMQHSPPRKRKTWTVKVPDDEGEDGAQVMDDFVDALAYEFGFDVDGGALTRYHTLARACAFAIQHRHDIPSEAKEG